MVNDLRYGTFAGSLRRKLMRDVKKVRAAGYKVEVIEKPDKGFAGGRAIRFKVRKLPYFRRRK